MDVNTSIYSCTYKNYYALCDTTDIVQLSFDLLSRAIDIIIIVYYILEYK